MNAEEEIKAFNDIDDEWGGIDNGILRAVKALVSFGIKTDGSCEGHIDHASPVPFISVFQIDTEYNLIEDETSVEFNKLVQLLNEFYSNRTVEDEYKIIGEEPAFIHNGKTLWNKWRKEIKERKIAKENGVTIERPALSQSEVEFRKEILPALQREFDIFAEFVEKN